MTFVITLVRQQHLDACVLLITCATSQNIQNVWAVKKSTLWEAAIVVC